MPIGIETIEILRTLTIESLAVFMPFKVQEVQHPEGIYYGENANPIILKSEFILSLCEQLMGKSLEPQQRSIIDRCTANVYKEYQERDYEGKPPTLKDFRNELLKQNEKEAKDVALAIETI